MVRGQCMKKLTDKTKHDPDWDIAITGYDTLKFMAIIEKTILDQT